MGKGRIPLAQQFMSRDGTLGVVDSFIQNACLSKQGEKIYVIKRPGTELLLNFGVVADPQGGAVYNDLIYAVYNDILHRSGGVINTGTLGDTWTQAPTPAWYGRAFFTATVFNGRIFVIGGESVQRKADINYSLDGFIWSQNASAAPFGHRQGHQACVFNGLLWVMGGTTDTDAATNDVWSSPDGNSWTQVTAAAAWEARNNFTLVAANNGMYLYGGNTLTSGVVDDVWFSTDGDTWTQLTATATGTARQLNAMFFFANKLWIVGGYSDVAGTATINDVNSSPDGQTWTVTAPVFGAGLANMSYTVYDNSMWLIAGDYGGALTSNIWQSNSDGSAWTLVTGAPGFTARGGAQAVSFLTPPSVSSFRYVSMWLLGGNDGATDLQEVWYGDLDKPLPSTLSFSPDVSGQEYQFDTFLNAAQLLIKNESNFWVLQSGSLTKVTDTNYPTATVPGIVVLNSFAYVMEPDGTIRACAIDNPLLWPSLQFVVADYEDDPGVAIAKYLNYLVAFGQYTIQFFYDAGNPAPGIPISPYQSTNIRIGCAAATSVKSTKNTLIWIGQTKERNVGVYMFEGLNARKVSTQWVDKAINVNINSGMRCWVTAMEGHTFYVINFFAAQSLVYDLDTQNWQTWCGGEFPTNAIPYSIGLTQFVTGGDLWLGTGSLGGLVYTASFEDYDDDGTLFDMRSQSDKVDGGNLIRKYWGQANVVADLNPATATLEVSDDDYQSWTTWGVFDLSLMRQNLNRGGSSRRRAFRLTQTDNKPARWEALEVTASEGES